MSIRFVIILLSVFVLQRCSTSTTSESTNQDTTSLHKAHTEIQSDQALPSSSAVPNTSLTELDTVFNLLVRNESSVKGTFADASVVTESLLNVGNPTATENYLMILVHTGEGEYAGLRDGIKFGTEYSWLVVLKEIAEGYEYVDHADLGGRESHGLVAEFTEGGELELMPGKFAAIIHSKGSEEGAGDYGYKRDNAQLFALNGDKIIKIFDVNLEDSNFSSNEMGSWSEQTSTTELKSLQSITMGLFDLMTTTVTESRQSDPDEDEVESDSEEEQNNEAASSEEDTDDGIDVYVWNGKEYVLKEE